MYTDIETLYDIYLAHPYISTDTRTIREGSLFFALKGETFDGNDYARSALDNGASFAIVDNPSLAGSEKLLLVKNALEALQELASYHRQKLGIPILAITGSNGKTTTKELLSRVLSKKFNISVTKGNLNNHIGVPLTLLSMAPDTEFGIVEMGANHQGEIKLLCSIAKPNYGIITNIGRSHLEGFGGPEGVIKGKGELFDYLDQNHGTAFYPSSDSTISEMAESRSCMTRISYDPALLKNSESDSNLLTVKFRESIIYTHLTGAYNKYNIAAALAIGEYFKVKAQDIIHAIESYIPENSRSQRIVTKNNILIKDCYNANPSSMAAAIDSFADGEESGYDKVLILGEMRELGDYSTEEHSAILNKISQAGISEAYLVGKSFSNVNKNLNFHCYDTVEELCSYLSGHALEGKFILLKGSRGIQLEKAEPFL